MVDRFRVPSWCAEKLITNSDAEGLSEFVADSSNSIPIWCATAFKVGEIWISCSSVQYTRLLMIHNGL